MSYLRELEVALQAARSAGELARKYQAQGVSPENKSDDSPVTIADREAEKLISSALRGAFPDDGLLGEEGASVEGPSGRRWIIDPIDGTRDFVRGNLLWAVLIGMEDKGEPVVGVAHFPALGRTFWATRGGGAYRDGVPLRASSKTELNDSVLLANGLALLNESAFGTALKPVLAEFMQQFWAVRSLGGSLDACMVASGEAEVWLEPKVAPWDLCAHKIILEEAGVRFLTMDGSNSIYAKHGVACAPGVAEEVMRQLRQLTSNS